LSAFARIIWGLLRDAGVPIPSGQNRNRKPTGIGQLGKNLVEEQVSYVRKKGRTHQSEEQHDRGRPPEDQREFKPDRICKSDGIEESDRVVNPKAPQTTRATLPPGSPQWWSGSSEPQAAKKNGDTPEKRGDLKTTWSYRSTRIPNERKDGRRRGKGRIGKLGRRTGTTDCDDWSQ
jgi:hypothetical protein